MTNTATNSDLKRNALITLEKLIDQHIFDPERTRVNYANSLPDKAERFRNEDELMREAQRYGHFFDEATMRAFRTKVYEIYGGRFLVISNRANWAGATREYRVVWLYQQPPTCNNKSHIHKSVGTLETRFPSLNAARKMARELVGLLDLIDEA